MKAPSNPSPWDELVRRARADVAPPVNLPALLRAVRSESPLPESGWLAEFAAVFTSRTALAVCWCAVGGAASVASWQAFELSQALPWVEWIAVQAGGGP